MFCTSCGRAIDASARFCSNCGAAVAGAPESAPFASGYATGSQTAGSVPPGYGGYPAGTLMRPRHPRMIAGVCAGIAQHYGADVTIVRLVLVLCVLFAGFGIGLYIIAWIVIPEAPYELPSAVGTMPGGPSI